MTDFVAQARAALAALKQRTRVALDKIERQEIDEAIQTLRWRDAAFHNFRAIDHRAMLAGTDLGADAALQQEWQELQPDLERLEQQLVRLQGETQKLATQVGRLRQQIASYHSGTRRKTRFRQSV